MAKVCEILSGVCNGVNLAFVSSQVPEPDDLRVFDDGVEVTVSTVVSTTITLASAPAASSIVFAVYAARSAEYKAIDLIRASLSEIGAIRYEDFMSPDDANIGLLHLNHLIQSSNLCQNAIFTARKDALTMTANQQSYTIGIDPDGVLTANFDIARPTKIKNIQLQLQSTTPVIYDDPMLEITDEQWARKKIPGIYTIPKQFYFEKSYPLGTLYFWPGPDSAYVIDLWTWQQGAAISDLYDAIAYPPGYFDFWMYQLAVRLCNPFEKQPSQLLIEMERRAIDRVSSANSVSPLVEPDPALVGDSRYGISWRTGELR